MNNPNQFSSDNSNEYTGWDELSDVEFSPVNISTDGVSKIELSDSPMGEGRQDKRVDVADANGMEQRTSNLMLGCNKMGVQIGKTYLSVDEFCEEALKALEEETVDEEFLYFVGPDGRRFATPPEVVDDMLHAIVGAGPEANISGNSNISNQDARSVEFSGPNGATQRGVFMLGNKGNKLSNGTYAEAGTIDAVIGGYEVAKKKVPEEDEDIPDVPEDTPDDLGGDREPKTTPPERIAGNPEEDEAPNKDIHQAILELAELYAKNRRLIAGSVNREKFETAKGEFQKILAEHLSGLGHAEYEAGFSSFSANMEGMTGSLASENVRELEEFSVGKTPEEIEAKREELRQAAVAKMEESYPDMVVNLETTVTSKVMEEYAKICGELESATIDALDNGTAWRKAVSKVITNKWVKGGLAVAATAGLAVAAIGVGRGVADGSMAVSVGYTLGGTIAGAVRGGLSGALMSRQSSKTSAIRGYGESAKSRTESGENLTIEGLAQEAMTNYGLANKADARSNKVRTAVSTGVGAGIGAAASGIHIDNIERTTVREREQIGTRTEKIPTGTATEEIQTGTTPEHYNVDMGKVDIQPGSGMGETFTDLGGDPSKIAEAMEIAKQFDASHSMVPGSNGVVAGAGGQVGNFAHTYPGTVDTWPQQAREYITQVAEEWAKKGLIESVKTGGEPILTTVEVPTFATVDVPIFDTISKTIVSRLPNTFYNALVQAEAAAASGVIGGVAQGSAKAEAAATSDATGDAAQGSAKE